MRLEREKWTPLTIVIETKEEAEILHKIIGATDYSDAAEDMESRKPLVDVVVFFDHIGRLLIAQPAVATANVGDEA